MQLTVSMVVFGTIGIFVRYIPLPSAAIACVRGAVGALFLLCVMALKKTKPDADGIKKNLLLLALSGGAIGFNWIFLFEAYRYTTVAAATLCYYMAPVIVIMASPFVFKEKMTVKKLLCVLAALVGMVFVSGVAGSGLPEAGELKGILFGLGAAVLYAGVIMMNKKISGISPYDKTAVQLAAAAVVVLPYSLLTGGFSGEAPGLWGTVLLMVVGVFHTGLTYYLYFGALDRLTSQTAAILSYIDPVVALILSALLLRENMGWTGALGAFLILGAAFVSELPSRKK